MHAQPSTESTNAPMACVRHGAAVIPATNTDKGLVPNTSEAAGTRVSVSERSSRGVLAFASKVRASQRRNRTMKHAGVRERPVLKSNSFAAIATVASASNAEPAFRTAHAVCTTDVALLDGHSCRVIDSSASDRLEENIFRPGARMPSSVPCALAKRRGPGRPLGSTRRTAKDDSVLLEENHVASGRQPLHCLSQEGCRYVTCAPVAVTCIQCTWLR